nr:hypothetical protein [Moraxella sp.]
MLDDYTDEFVPEIGGISLREYENIVNEIENQPSWRAIADQDMDYADGKQLDSDLLRRQKELGIPPAVENRISPALRSLSGYEATTRTDWRVTPNGEVEGREVAEAINYKLNQAEKKSKADKACSNAFSAQIACGIGWVEVSRESDPFKYPYRCRAVHRNEIHWDMTSEEPDLSDARWLRRQKWLRPERIAQAFPEHAELVYALGKHGSQWYELDPMMDGDGDTGLQNAWHQGRHSTIAEHRWYNQANKEMCLVELWYRRWVTIFVIKTPNGRVVEYDANNPSHIAAVAYGKAKVLKANVSKVRRSYWLGRHCLYDGESPYKHSHFPYVPFIGFKEDLSGVPFGYVRDMRFPQDSLNSGISKLRWAMSVVRVERTKGAVDMTDAQLRKQIAKPNSDIVLNHQHMAQQGSRFEVHRDYQLTDQHYQMLQDNRASIVAVSDITQGFMGKAGNATSGRQEQMQIEQSNQSLAVIMDNFRQARTLIGEQLMALIIEDMGNDEQALIIAGDAITPARKVVVNKPEVDPETGMVYLSNDIQRTALSVSLEDVPSTNTYRGQQLNAMSEAVKSLPPQYQAAVLPFMMSLMDIPKKEQVIEAIKQAQQQQTPEQIQQQIDQAVQEALLKANIEIKNKEFELKQQLSASEIKEREAKAVQIGVQAAYAAMQAGAQVAQIPQIAPVADEIMKSAGYQAPNPIGDDPNYPTAAIPIAPVGSEQLPQVKQNTSPAMPPVPQQAPSPMKGIETPRTTDNLG